MTRSLSEYIAYFFEVIHMKEAARAVRALEGHFAASIPDEHQRMARIELCLNHIVALCHHLGGWDAVRAIIDEISPRPQSVEHPLPAERGLTELIRPIGGASPDPELVAKLTRPINELGLGMRLYNILYFANIRWVYELVQKTPDQLMQIKKIGEKALQEIKRVLAAQELTLDIMFGEAVIAAVRTEIARKETGR